MSTGPSMSSYGVAPRAYSINNQSTSSEAGPSRNPATPLRTVKSTSGSGFEFPAIWSFPPFFTLQPNATTLSHQLELWSQLVLSWARAERVWEVNCDAADGGGEVFWNKTISRRLLPASKRQLMEHMSRQGTVIAEPPKQTNTYLLYWRKPEEWGGLIYDWIVETGQTGTILTFYELTEGDLSSSTDFRELHPAILRRALDILVKRGRAQIIRGAEGDGDGVRFL